MTLSFQQRLLASARPAIESFSPAVMPLSLTAASNQPVCLPGDTWRVTAAAANHGAADSEPVKFQASVYDPANRETVVLPSGPIPEPVPAGYVSPEIQIPLTPTGGYRFTALDQPGIYRFVFTAAKRTGEVLGSAVAETRYLGAGLNTTVSAGLIPSAERVDLGQELSITARIRNVSGREQRIKVAIVAQYTGAGGPEIPVYIITPPQQAAATVLAIGYDQAYPFTWARDASWPLWCELPHTFRESDKRGNYVYGLAIYDYATDPANPEDWASQPLLSYALATVGYNDLAHAAGIPNLEHVLLHNQEQLDIDDLDALTRAQFDTGGFFLGLMSGFTNWLKGFQLEFDPSGNLFMGAGYGWQFKELVIPGGQWERRNPADPLNPDMRKGDYRRYNSYPILQTNPRLFIGSLADHAPPAAGTRYDLICVEAAASDEGVTPGSASDLRQFVKPEIRSIPDGRPAMETAAVATRRRMGVRVHWVHGLADPIQTLALPPPDGSIIAGYVAVSAAALPQIGMLPYPAATVQDHRSKTPLDHPLGSVTADHLTAGLSGGWQQGADLNLRTLSQAIIAARGGFGGPAGLDNRLKGVVDADGAPVQAAFEAGIQSALDTLFSGIADARGNLLSSAVAGAIAGKASYVRALMGTTKDGALLPRIPGFADEEQFAIVSIADLFYNFGAPAVGVWYLRIRCYLEGWVARCYSECEADVVDQTERKKIIVNGDVNFLVLGIKTAGE